MDNNKIILFKRDDHTLTSKMSILLFVLLECNGLCINLLPLSVTWITIVTSTGTVKADKDGTIVPNLGETWQNSIS